MVAAAAVVSLVVNVQQVFEAHEMELMVAAVAVAVEEMGGDVSGSTFWEENHLYFSARGRSPH